MREVDEPWGPARRFGLVFLAVLWSLLWIPLLTFEIPVVGDMLVGLWLWLWATLMPILGNAALGIEGPIDTMPNGSSDMTWNYVQLLWFAVLALVAASAGVALERRQAVYEALYAWLRILVRYALALAMIGYGLIKVFHLQMRPLDVIALSRTYAESSPGGLLWTFMGFSPGYQAFTGLAEVLAGLLLMSRRTTTLGALLAAGVMANVAMMNFCYDVAVKLVATDLLLMAVFLAAHDRRRLLDVFVRNRATAPVDLNPPVLGPRLRLIRVVAKTGFLALMGWSAIQTMQRAWRPVPPPPPLYGAWDVEGFTVDGQELPAPARWRQLVIPAFPMAMVRSHAGVRQSYASAHDAEAGTLTLTTLEPPETTLVLSVAQPAADELVLTGPIGAGPTEVRLRRVPTEEGTLMTRGFRWIIDGADMH